MLCGLRHLKAPSLSLAGFRLVIADHAIGLPVLRTLSLCTCCRHYPGAAAGRILRSAHPAVSAFPGSACALSFSRIAQRSLALRPAHLRRHLYVTCYTEGSSHFVTSMTAPVASGWSVSPGGACTHWKAPPLHGAHVKRPLRIAAMEVAVGGKPSFHRSRFAARGVTRALNLLGP